MVLTCVLQFWFVDQFYVQLFGPISGSQTVGSLNVGGEKKKTRLGIQTGSRT
jgi:hypothetical protein